MTEKPTRFIHLNVRSNYAIGEGAIYTQDMIAFCERTQSPAIGITDTNNLYGVLEFSKELSNAGLQPIIGIQLNIIEKTQAPLKGYPLNIAEEISKITLLVRSKEGYQNILSLLSIIYLENIQQTPYITLENLEDHKEGLILLSGGSEGLMNKAIKNGKMEQAQAYAKEFKRMFKGDFYIELMRHNDASEEKHEDHLIELAYNENIPLVATNAPHFPNKDMYEAHDAYLCIAQGVTINDTHRKRLTPEHYLKTPEEMIERFSDIPEAIINTEVIAKKCRFFCQWQQIQLPSYSSDEKELLKTRAQEGLTERLKKNSVLKKMPVAEQEQQQKLYKGRLDYELDVILQMQFEGYFLIVSDFISWAKDNRIPVGPGRGSGAGSLVAYALRITEVDPIRFGLLFERFLNPDRVSMPDFDIDFCQARRDEVIKYVQQKYGKDRVANIITFGKLQARAVVRDVGRVLEIPYGQINDIAKQIPFNPANPQTLGQILNESKELQSMMAKAETIKKLFAFAQALEGLYRHVSTHAAGVVIGAKPLKEIVPLYREPSTKGEGSESAQKEGIPVTGFSMKYVESAGLVKFDFLGLKTLTVIAKTVEIIKKVENIDLNIEHLTPDDPKVFEFLSTGKTVGIFQMESSGMRNVLTQMKPDSIEDIIAIISLYRPGPMENIPSYINRKHKKEGIQELHTSIDPVLQETFGIMVYQEQVMEIAKRMGGYTLGAADLLRRSMGKKDKKEMRDHRKIFIQGAKKNNIPKEVADGIFSLMEKFAGYGFNKSHAAAYAIIAYQTAYLKTKHQEAFLAASMSLDSDDVDKLAIFVQEARQANISLYPPDINKSEVDFTVESKGIRYALSAIKGLGEKIGNTIVSEREKNGLYTSVQNFLERVTPKDLNKRYLESLIKAGAFDTLTQSRATLAYEKNIESMLAFNAKTHEEKESNQIGLFSSTETKNEYINSLTLIQQEDNNEDKAARDEKNSIGFYLTKHPLALYKPLLAWLKIEEIYNRKKDTQTTNVAGIVESKKYFKTLKGKDGISYRLSDTSGTFEMVYFPEDKPLHLEINALYIIENAIIDPQRGRMQIKNAKNIEHYYEDEQQSFHIIIKQESLLTLLALFLDHKGNKIKGNHQASIEITKNDKTMLLYAEDTININGKMLNALLAEGAVITTNPGVDTRKEGTHKEWHMTIPLECLKQIAPLIREGKNTIFMDITSDGTTETVRVKHKAIDTELLSIAYYMDIPITERTTP